MSIAELSRAELDELRQALYYGCDEYDHLADGEKQTVDNAEHYWEIPVEILASAFGHYSFVPEDFFCSLEK